MSKQRRSGNNVVAMTGLQRGTSTRALARANGAGDARTQEAMRMVEAFLAIEDVEARRSLIALAERLVSYDWLRKTQRRFL